MRILLAHNQGLNVAVGLEGVFSEVRDTCDDARREIGAKWGRGRE
jgi:hypothetical protein